MSYEFSESENQVFSSLSKAMKFVGIFQIVMGALQGLLAILAIAGTNLGGAASAAIQAGLLVTFGLLTVRAAEPVMMIVTTQGDDIGHLMSAMRQLDKLYNLQKIVMIVALALGVIGGLLAALFLLT